MAATPPMRPRVQVGVTPWQATAPPRPRGIAVSCGVWLGACVLGMITVAVTLIQFDRLQVDMLSVVARRFPNESLATRDSVATAAVSVLIAVGVLVILLQLGLAIAMRSGRGWTRFALVLFALVGIGYTVAIFSAVPEVTRAGLLVTSALMVVATVPMFLRDAQKWFAYRGLVRSAAGGDADGGW